MLSPEIMCVLAVRFVISVTTLTTVMVDHKFKWKKLLPFFLVDVSIGIVAGVIHTVKY